MKKTGVSKTIKCALLLGAIILGAVCQAQLFTKGEGFSKDSHIVSTSFFHWYTSDAGQKVGPWPPLEGRENWTGSVAWWKGQIKQTMLANIDVLYVHLIQQMDEQRLNLFKALSELRAEGYDTPAIAPFLDPMIIWSGTILDLSTPAGKQELTSHYVRFYTQYFSVNTDEFAGSHLAKIDGRLVLVSWHVRLNTSNLDQFKREDLEKELAKQFSNQCPEFDNGIHMITTAVGTDTFRFVDEKAFIFELHSYHAQTEFNGIVAAMVKPGYWDQNVRNPGFCLARDGGVNYRNAWQAVLSNKTLDRVYVESWNEYDEGSGIYAGNPVGFYTDPFNQNTNADVWSTRNDPFEYIKTTANGARHFNDTPDYAAKILTHDVPSVLQAGKEYNVTVVVRNEGDVLWNEDGDIKLFIKGFQDTNQLWTIRMTPENLAYGGIYRGCPLSFKIKIVAPATAGSYRLKMGMNHAGTCFGEELDLKLKVEQVVFFKGSVLTDGLF